MIIIDLDLLMCRMKYRLQVGKEGRPHSQLLLLIIPVYTARIEYYRREKPHPAGENVNPSRETSKRSILRTKNAQLAFESKLRAGPSNRAL